MDSLFEIIKQKNDSMSIASMNSFLKIIVLKMLLSYL